MSIGQKKGRVKRKILLFTHKAGLFMKKKKQLFLLSKGGGEAWDCYIPLLSMLTLKEFRKFRGS